MSGEPFAVAMEVIPDHGERMKKAAMLGKEGGANMEQFFSGILDENAWVTTYGIVAAMAAKRVDLLQNVIYKHPSWLVRSRAVQTLAKLDQERTAAVMMNPESPKQLKTVALAALRICSDEILECIVSDPSWGGISEAVTLLDRTKRGNNSAVMKKWLVKLMSMSTLSSAPKEEAQIYQGIAAKYGEVMLQLLREQTVLGKEWYRACMVLCKDFPDQMLQILESKKSQGSAIWYIARPLIRYRPTQVITILVARGTIDDAFLRCAKKVWAHNTHRQQFLDGIADILKQNKRVSKTSKRGLNRLLRSLKKKPERKVGEILLDILCYDRLKTTVFGCDHLIKTTADTYDTEVTKDQLANFIIVQLNFKHIPLFETLKGDKYTALINAAWEEVEKDFPELVEKTFTYVCASGNPGKLIPKTCAIYDKFYKFLEEYVDGQEYPELLAIQKCNCLAFLPFHDVKERIVFLLSDRDVGIREIGLKFYWECGIAVGDLKSTLEVLRFLEKRLKKEQDEIKQTIIPKILELHPTKLLSDAAPTLELLFNVTLKWGKGPWVDGWLRWCACTWMQYSAISPKPEDQMLMLSTQIVTQLCAAEHTNLESVFQIFADHLRQLIFDAKIAKKADTPPELKSIDEPGIDICLSHLAEILEEFGNNWSASYCMYSENSPDIVKEQYQTFNTFAGCFVTLEKSLFHRSERIQNFCQVLLEKVVFDGGKNLQIPATLISLSSSRNRAEFLDWGVFRKLMTRCLKYIEVAASKINWAIVGSTKERAATAAEEFLRSCPMMSMSHVQGFFRAGIKSDLARHLLGWTVPYADLMQIAASAYTSGVSGWTKTHSSCTAEARIIKHLEWMPNLVDILLMDAKGQHNSRRILQNIGYPTEFTSQAQVLIAKKFMSQCNRDTSSYLITGATHCISKKLQKTKVRAADVGDNKSRPRFRFQRGANSQLRKDKTKQKKNKNRLDSANTNPQIGSIAVEMLKVHAKKFASVSDLPELLSLIKTLLQPRYPTKTMSDVADAAIEHLFTSMKAITKAQKSTYHLYSYYFSHLEDAITRKPELLRFFQENINYNISGIVDILLKPMHTRKIHANLMLTKGCGSLTPTELFTNSITLQKYAIEHRQDVIPGLLQSKIEDYSGFVGYCSDPRFSGQTTQGADRLFCLKPSVQSVLWKKLTYPEPSFENYFEGYELKVWLGASLNCPDDIPSLDDNEHPFRKLLAKSLEEAALLEEIKKKAREGVEKNQVVERSQEEIDQETKVSKFTQIHTELLKAICAYDNHKQALHLLKEHLDCGVACKTVIPSVSMSLACVSPNDAYEVLDEILGRKDTKVSARQQLSRAVVKLLTSDKADLLIRQEWRDDSWIVVDDKPDPPADKAVKVAIICSLVGSPILRQLPKLWHTIESIGQSEDLSEENRYIAKELLSALAGSNGVATLNLESWPYCGMVGLPELCSKFIIRKSLESISSIALERWLDYIVADPTYVLNHQDAEAVLDGIQQCGNYPNLLSKAILTLYERGYTNAFSRTVSKQVDCLQQAVRNQDLTSVTEALSFFNTFGSTPSKSLIKCLKGSYEAVDLLIKNKMTTPSAIQILGSLLQASAEDHMDYVVRIFRKIGWEQTVLMSDLMDTLNVNPRLTEYVLDNLTSDCDMTRYVCLLIASEDSSNNKKIIALVDDPNDHISSLAVSALVQSF